jgi:superfamily II DNA or RNA helicase
MPGIEPLSAVELSLVNFVDIGAFQRGRQYARERRVIEARWQLPKVVGFGVVQGNGGDYETSFHMQQAPSGRLTAFNSSCDCPVATNCKHGVALALTLLHDRPAAPSTSPRAWERALAGLLQDEPVAEPPRVALGFEVVESSPSRWQSGATVRRVGMRPLSPGRNGWVRTGISWQTIGSAWSSSRDLPAEQLRLLREIVALEQVGSSGGYYYAAAARLVHFDDIPTPRIWDTLADAVTAGIPLVTGPRGSIEVSLTADPARLTVALRRGPEGLAVAPEVSWGDAVPPIDEILPLGSPPHGLAWTPRGGDELRLARLASTPHAAIVRLLEQRQVVVPAADEADFLNRYVPSLRERVVVVVDGDIDLPEPAPPVLVVELLYTPHRDTLEVSWHWRYTVGDHDHVEPLQPPRAARSRNRDLEHEALTVKTVVTALGDGSPLLQPDTDGSHALRAHTWVSGVEALKVLTAVPDVAALPGVEVVEVLPLPSRRMTTSAPVLDITTEPVADDRDWFDLSVQVTIDGEDVPFDQLFVALARQQSYLVLPSGTWFRLDVPELQTLRDLIDEARALTDPGPRSARVSRYHADFWDTLEQLGVVENQSVQWRSAVAALAGTAELEPPPVPAGVAAKLRPYQVDGYGWLAMLQQHDLGGVLADEMGLGKTLQTIALIARTREKGTTAPFLVVAPTSVVFTWASECRRFAPGLEVRVVGETVRRSGVAVADAVEGADVVVTSYALFRIDFDHYAAVEWAGLVLDEAQAVKNPKSRGYACARQLETPFKLAITGTPMENNLTELWALLSITSPGLFPHPKGFDEHFRNPIEKHRDADRLAVLRRRIKPFMLRRTKEEVAAELPPKQEQVLELPLEPRHRKIYERHLQRERQKVLGLLGDLEKNRFEIFRSLTLLRQACLDPMLVDTAYAGIPATKLDTLVDLVGEIAKEGHRALVFSQFTRFLGAARERLEAHGVATCYLDGTTRNRPAVIESFRSGSAPAFLISLKAGGVGLTLTEADYCILLDPWWNPATENQAIDRTHRIGQTKPVMVYRLVAKDTIEDKVMALKARKAALFDSVLSGGDATGARLSAADIRGILD